MIAWAMINFNFLILVFKKENNANEKEVTEQGQNRDRF